MALASMPWRLSILFVFCICFITAVSGVKSSDFKTCSQVTPSLLTTSSNPYSRVSVAEIVTSPRPSPPTHIALLSSSNTHAILAFLAPTPFLFPALLECIHHNHNSIHRSCIHRSRNQIVCLTFGDRCIRKGASEDVEIK